MRQRARRPEPSSTAGPRRSRSPATSSRPIARGSTSSPRTPRPRPEGGAHEMSAARVHRIDRRRLLRRVRYAARGRGERRTDLDAVHQLDPGGHLDTDRRSDPVQRPDLAHRLDLVRQLNPVHPGGASRTAGPLHGGSGHCVPSDDRSVSFGSSSGGPSADRRRRDPVPRAGMHRDDRRRLLRRLRHAGVGRHVPRCRSACRRSACGR
ncbi:hypothetical protein BN12_2000004 [Nostocoides japonicum T1-X7]|uniref:Uncharacterized protein n=1 Tax=Nostocoides japonicum T1-X7 TaxID=1194083 RepID=A0A077LV42_9MICO|nr:hypothetical protein BN12_2000004 [Tetrasphaera japonica T1-X7]